MLAIPSLYAFIVELIDVRIIAGTLLTYSFGNSLSILRYKEGFNNLSVHVLEGACAALRALHAAGYSHNDIAPGNILVGPNHQIKLCGFSSTRKMGESDTEIRGTRGFCYRKVFRTINNTLVPACDYNSLFCVVKWMLNKQFRLYTSTTNQARVHILVFQGVEWPSTSQECEALLKSKFGRG